jgi:hypothetical protein
MSLLFAKKLGVDRLLTAVLDRPRVERPAARDDSRLLALAAAA